MINFVGKMVSFELCRKMVCGFRDVEVCSIVAARTLNHKKSAERRKMIFWQDSENIKFST